MKKITVKQNEIKTQIAEGGPQISADRTKLVTIKKGKHKGEVKLVTIDSF
jgi:hypothetical protein